ncbi:MAG: hypothetical protein LBF62_08840 [Tannerellaceae bacterium]|jgi:hypothetical protein|nr:hypothetical protein [Tannerellaceae bacterium]
MLKLINRNIETTKPDKTYIVSPVSAQEARSGIFTGTAKAIEQKPSKVYVHDYERLSFCLPCFLPLTGVSGRNE